MAKKRITSVSVETLPPAKMRYRTVGDWFFRPDDSSHLVIQVADSGNWVYNMLVAIHEFIEVFLCTVRGITQEQVDRFDTAHEGDPDPGSHPFAPYRDQHMMAMSSEMAVATSAGVKWRVYEAALEAAWKKTRRK